MGRIQKTPPDEKVLDQLIYLSSDVVIAEEMTDPIEDVEFEIVVVGLHPIDESLELIDRSQVVVSCVRLDRGTPSGNGV